MKSLSNGLLALTALWMYVVWGCAANEYTRMNAPPQGDAPAHPQWRDYYTYHNDQGMLADMAIADLHFVPHSTCLSGVGEARLVRYAELLAARGGTLNYDTCLNDTNMVDARLKVVKDFLAQATPTGGKIDVVVGPAGGRGMSNKEAAAAAAVAQQPEPRKTAYRLNSLSTLQSSGN